MADADKSFLTKLLREMRPGVLPITPKQSDRDIPSIEEIEIPQVPHQDQVDNFFSTLKA